MSVLLAHLLPLVDEVPKDEDVKAGWVAFAIFIGLVLAMVVIGWALRGSLRRSNATAAAGGYDERTARGQRPAQPRQDEQRSQDDTDGQAPPD